MTSTPLLAPVGCPAGVEPHEWREAVARRIAELSDQMTALLEVLDVMDGDPDFEPTLGAPEAKVGGYVPGVASSQQGDQTHWSQGVNEDGENEPLEDDEPSLGGPAMYVGDGRYEVDLELDRVDDEPILGWTEDEPVHGYASTFNTDEHEVA